MESLGKFEIKLKFIIILCQEPAPKQDEEMEFETVEEMDTNEKDVTEEEQLTVIDDVDDGSEQNRDDSVDDEQGSELEEELDDDDDEDLDRSRSVTPSTSLSSRSGMYQLYRPWCMLS